MSGEEFFCCLNLATSTQLTVYRNLTSTEEVELFFPPEITLHKTFPVYCHIFGDLCHVYPDSANIHCPPAPMSQDEIKINTEKNSISFKNTHQVVGILHGLIDQNARIFVPTRNHKTIETETIWNHKIFTINTNQMAGEPIPNLSRINTCFRWDLIKDFTFPEFKMLRRILVKGKNPNHDCYLCTTDTDLKTRTFVGGDGCKFVDNTNLRIVRYQTLGFRTFPIINGCLLTTRSVSNDANSQVQPFHFGGTKIQFDEETEKIKMTDFDTDPPCVYYIYPSNIITFAGKAFLEYVPV